MKFLLLAALSTGCAAPAVLGHDDPESITTVCADGTKCPVPYVCPAPFSGGHCEAPIDMPSPEWARRADAGTRDGG